MVVFTLSKRGGKSLDWRLTSISCRGGGGGLSAWGWWDGGGCDADTFLAPALNLARTITLLLLMTLIPSLIFLLERTMAGCLCTACPIDILLTPLPTSWIYTPPPSLLPDPLPVFTTQPWYLAPVLLVHRSKTLRWRGALSNKISLPNVSLSHSTKKNDPKQTPSQMSAFGPAVSGIKKLPAADR